MAWMRTPDAARALNLSERHVRDLGASGKLERRPVKNGYEYKVSDLPTLEEQDAAVYGADAATRELAARLGGDVPQPKAAPDSRTRNMGTHIPKHSVTRIAWASDVHWPHEDSRVWLAFLRWLADNEIDELILGGDILDLESCSAHGGVARPALLLEEVDYANARLDEVQEYHRGKITFLEGNHEERLSRAIIAGLPALFGSVDLPRLLDFAGRGIAWRRYGEIVHRGKLGFTHGWWCPKYAAQKHLEHCGAIVFGHTHRVRTASKRQGLGDVVHAYGMPTMEQDPGWLKGKPHDWSLGWGYIEIDEETGNYQVSQILAPEGRAIWGGKVYAG